MTTPTTIAPDGGAPGALAWPEAVRRLADDVRSWSEEAGWQVRAKEYTLTEDPGGGYELPLLVIQLPNHPVFLEPVSGSVAGASGRVDLYAYPSLSRVMLLLKNGRWTVRPELGPPWPKAWGRETFLELANLLASDE